MNSPRRQACALPDTETAEVCRGLGLAISNAAVYGSTHRVTAESVAAVYDRLVNAVDLYGDIEFSSCEEGLLLNGQLADIGRGMGQNLLDQMRRGGINNLKLCAPLDRGEFTRFVNLFVDASTAGGTLADAIARSAFRGIRVDESVYARVAKEADRPAPAQAGPEAPDSGRGSQRGSARGAKAGSRVFDLDSDLALEGPDALTGAGSMDFAADVLSAASTATRYIQQLKTARRQRQAMIDMLARHAGNTDAMKALHEQFIASGMTEGEWLMIAQDAGVAPTAPTTGAATNAVIHQLLEDVESLSQNKDEPGYAEALDHILDSISQQVETLIGETKGRTTSLAERVEADRETVAELESRARADGLGLHLSREELLTSLAEINQELVQPLTASNALLQILASGSIGELSGQQQDFIQQTTVGLQRLETLIDYLQRISGLPTELTPDSALLNEIYQGR